MKRGSDGWSGGCAVVWRRCSVGLCTEGRVRWTRVECTGDCPTSRVPAHGRVGRPRAGWASVQRPIGPAVTRSDIGAGGVRRGWLSLLRVRRRMGFVLQAGL